MSLGDEVGVETKLPSLMYLQEPTVREDRTITFYAAHHDGWRYWRMNETLKPINCEMTLTLGITISTTSIVTSTIDNGPCDCWPAIL